MKYALLFCSMIIGCDVVGSEKKILKHTIEQLGKYYWHYLKTGKKFLFDDMIKTQDIYLTADDMARIEQYIVIKYLSFPLATSLSYNLYPCIELAHSQVPKFIDDLYMIVTPLIIDNLALSLVKISDRSLVPGNPEYDTYAFLGPKNIRVGIAEAIIQKYYESQGTQQYLYILKDFTDIADPREAYRTILAHVEQKTREVQKILNSAQERCRHINYVSVSQFDQRITHVIVAFDECKNEKIQRKLKVLLHKYPTLQIIIAFDDKLDKIDNDISIPVDIQHVIIVGKSINSIGDYFFAESLNLETIDFGYCHNISKIGNGFLSECKKLVNIDMSSFKSVTEIENGFLAYCESLPTVDLTVFSALKSIGNYFLYNCHALTHLNFNELASLVHVGDGFLSHCINLVSFAINSVVPIRTIGNDFLFGCENLLDVEFTGLLNLRSIGNRFLAHCTNLPFIDLTPLSNITQINKLFLADCQNLTSIRLSKNVYALIQQNNPDFFKGENKNFKVEIAPTALPSALAAAAE